MTREQRSETYIVSATLYVDELSPQHLIVDLPTPAPASGVAHGCPVTRMSLYSLAAIGAGGPE